MPVAVETTTGKKAMKRATTMQELLPTPSQTIKSGASEKPAITIGRQCLMVSSPATTPDRAGGKRANPGDVGEPCEAVHLRGGGIDNIAIIWYGADF
jgi:hypothetical protein